MRGAVKMKIKTFTYFNKETNLEIEKIEFGDINLLVGVSGAGKTQILNKLYELSQLASGRFSIERLGSIKAEVTFEVGGKQFLWKIETNKNNEIEIIGEALYIDGAEYFTRTVKEIRLEGATLPSISSQLSLLNAYKEYNEIMVLTEGIRHIIFPDLDENIKHSIGANQAKIISVDAPESYVYPSNSSLSHLYRALEVNPEIFLKIKEEFISIFPQVRDIKFQYEEEKMSNFVGISPLEIKRYVLYIQDLNGVWIRQHEISSGMMKTLFHLTYLKTIGNYSVILIDEFENGLGINCMQEVTNDIICADHLQFILTSHHPYIINNIGMGYWKVVFRKGNKICTRTAQELGLGKSKHDAFFQLMNKLQYDGEI